MGQIKQDVRDNQLSNFPLEEVLLRPFLSGFDVSWGRRRRAYNTELSIYFLKPEPFISQMFGFEHEVALFVTDYPTLEARVMQAVDTLIGEDPARGRVEQGIFFLIAPAVDGKEWVVDYTMRNPQARIPIVFSSHALINSESDSWLVRNLLRDQLFTRDLFDYQLPLDNDLFFFGRDKIVADHLDAIRRSQNRGLFGLRKTGKTSILYKLQRMIDREGLGTLFYYDCKLPSIRMLSWHELLVKVVLDIVGAYKLPRPAELDEPKRISDVLINVLKALPDGKIISLVFDEIEYISPMAIDDPHWHKEFVPFWQTLWAAQSQVRKLSNTVVGVNPSVVEQDTINDIQNPMFGIIQPRYLKGLSIEEMRGMIRFFGKRMGLSFTPEASEYLYQRYGGHPLLTRMACSEIHEACDRKTLMRPVELSKSDLTEDEEVRDAELTFYCRHVVSELKKFYPDEYEMLEMLSSGQIIDVMDLSVEPEYTRHLKEYGLLRVNEVRVPSFAIPVVGQYIGNELARKERRRLVRRVVPIHERSVWVKRRVEMIVREIRDLIRVVNSKSIDNLYGHSSFPEAERFLGITVVSSNDEFVAFINVCNRCLVESVERTGRELNIKNYFWNNVKQAYPDLWSGLQRVKLYRNNDLHLELLPAVEEELNKYIDSDLEGRRISQVPDVWFVFQQSVLDGLLLGVQCELNRYN